MLTIQIEKLLEHQDCRIFDNLRIYFFKVQIGNIFEIYINLHIF